MIANNTKQILSKYNVYAQKGYGQNFLINQEIVDAIVKQSGLNSDCGVIEIGPGIGTLTEGLASVAKKVLAYEIDPKMVKIMEDTLFDFYNLTVLHMDFLNANLDKHINEYLGDVSEVKVVANLPYYITTPILFKLLESNCVNEFVIMVQKEVGERLVGKVGSKEYNALSVFMRYKTQTNIVIKVSRKFFYPEPNVDSVVLHIKTVKNEHNIKNEPKFLEFIRFIFHQKRKTLVNNIVAAYGMKKIKIEKHLVNLGINPAVRAEALDINHIVQIFKTLIECMDYEGEWKKINA